MANTKISELPVYTGDTAGAFLVMNSPDLSTTYRVTKEDIAKISGTVNKFAYFDATDSLTSSLHIYNTNGGETIGIGTDAYNQAQPERLMVSAGNSWNISTFQTTAADSYAEVNIINFGGGANSSTDLVLWNDSTTEESGFLDIGINSSNYTGGEGGYAGDAYVITTASDLYLGSYVSGSHGHVHIFGGGNAYGPQISVFQDKTIGFNTDFGPGSSTIPTSGYTYEFSGSIISNHDFKAMGYVETGMLQGTGSITLKPDLNDSRTIEIYNTDPADVHIKGNAAYTFLGDDVTFVKLDTLDGQVSIKAEASGNSGSWVFGSDGVMILNNGAAQIYSDPTSGEVVIGTAASNVAPNVHVTIGGDNAFQILAGPPQVKWDFQMDGTLQLPNYGNISGSISFYDNTVQNSAAISIVDLKSLVAASTDFNDFKTRIAAL